MKMCALARLGFIEAKGVSKAALILKEVIFHGGLDSGKPI
jgi:hypothetical protein